MEDFMRHFLATYSQIQSIAYCIIFKTELLLFRFEKWSPLDKHPYEKIISSWRSGELFFDISERVRNKFFTLQGRCSPEDECWAYDTTSLSS